MVYSILKVKGSASSVGGSYKCDMKRGMVWYGYINTRDGMHCERKVSVLKGSDVYLKHSNN